MGDSCEFGFGGTLDEVPSYDPSTFSETIVGHHDGFIRFFEKDLETGRPCLNDTIENASLPFEPLPPFEDLLASLPNDDLNLVDFPTIDLSQINAGLPTHQAAFTELAERSGGMDKTLSAASWPIKVVRQIQANGQMAYFVADGPNAGMRLRDIMLPLLARGGGTPEARKNKAAMQIADTEAQGHPNNQSTFGYPKVTTHLAGPGSFNVDTTSMNQGLVDSDNKNALERGHFLRQVVQDSVQPDHVSTSEIHSHLQDIPTIGSASRAFEFPGFVNRLPMTPDYPQTDSNLYGMTRGPSDWTQQQNHGSDWTTDAPFPASLLDPYPNQLQISGFGESFRLPFNPQFSQSSTDNYAVHGPDWQYSPHRRVRSDQFGTLVTKPEEPAQPTKAQASSSSVVEQVHLQYHSLEEADEVNRKSPPEPRRKDVTEPHTPEAEQKYVLQIINAMNDMSRATDNPKAKDMWKKLKRNSRAVELAAWQLLKKSIQGHGQSNPLVEGGKMPKRYEKFDVRMNELCFVLKQQKTVCKHVLAPPYVDLLLDDPIAAKHRVDNNRKVNSGKKICIELGKKQQVEENLKRALKKESVVDSVEEGDYEIGPPNLLSNARSTGISTTKLATRALSGRRRKAEDDSDFRPKRESKQRKTIYPVASQGGNFYIDETRGTQSRRDDLEEETSDLVSPDSESNYSSPFDGMNSGR